MGSIFRGKAVQVEVSRNVGNYHSTLRNVPEEGRFYYTAALDYQYCPTEQRNRKSWECCRINVNNCIDWLRLGNLCDEVRLLFLLLERGEKNWTIFQAFTMA
jgi:hypothetical protein